MRLSISAALLLLGVAWTAPSHAAGEHQLARLTPHRLTVDRVIVLKSARELYLIAGSHIVRNYRIALGRYPSGHKIKQGDSRTPEGRYTLDFKLDDSAFHRAIHISYPNEADRERADVLGVDPGGQIMIHGLPPDWTARSLGHPNIDWTNGCIAVTNAEIDEISKLVPTGTPIEIYP